jgi:hypothetical protein
MIVTQMSAAALFGMKPVRRFRVSVSMLPAGKHLADNRRYLNVLE